jgi:hypothetical protein
MCCRSQCAQVLLDGSRQYSCALVKNSIKCSF